MAKSDRRKLAESIAAKKGIAVKSAMRYLQRVAAPEGKQRIKQPRYTGFTPYLKKRTRAELGFVTPRKKKAAEVIREFIPEILTRRNFNYDGVRLLKLRGRVELGSSGAGDIRDRFVNVPVNAETANDIFNAEDLQSAIELFQKQAPYLADVVRFDRFEFGGDIFDAGDFE